MRLRVPRGLRARIVLGFAVGALLVSAVLAGTTWLLARNYLTDQRERSLTQQAFADANALATQLSTAGADVGDLLAELTPSGDADVVVRSAGSWFSSGLDAGAADVPAELRSIVEGGAAGSVVTAGRGGGVQLVVGVPLRASGVQFYEVSQLSELQQVLRTLALDLTAGALAATAAGAGFGVAASRRAVAPLAQVAGAATEIAGGNLGTRLPATTDPDLAAIVGGFNSMVDALSARLERDARFVGDVSHELRSPLTSMTTTVEVLAARSEELPARAQQAVALLAGELGRFRRTLDDLLDLARLDSSPGPDTLAPVDLATLVAEVLRRDDRRPPPTVTFPEAGTATVSADKHRLERALVQLLDNAEAHAGGAVAVVVRREGESVLVSVDDAGPGVREEDRLRVFDRFARGSHTVRASTPGTGLGLSIVAETMARHGGGAWCTARAPQGSRFVLSLPAVPDPAAGEAR